MMRRGQLDGMILKQPSGEEWEVMDPPWWRVFRRLGLLLRRPTATITVEGRKVPVRSVPRPYAELDAKVDAAPRAARKS